MSCINNADVYSVIPVVVVLLVVFALLTGIVVILVKTWIYCRIFSKAGYSWALGLLTLVPIANIIMPFVLALGDWPALKELRRLRESAKTPARTS